jgi:hypothetical protein
MRHIASVLVPLMLAAMAYGQTEEPSGVAIAFFQALRAGDSTSVDTLVSEDALSAVGVLLTNLKQNIRSDESAMMLRLSSAGYTASADDIRDWDARMYLKSTVALPIMMARYAPYQMVIDSVITDGDEARLLITFLTAAGFTIQSEALLVMEDDRWRVASFMGLNSFP